MGIMMFPIIVHWLRASPGFSVIVCLLQWTTSSRKTHLSLFIRRNKISHWIRRWWQRRLTLRLVISLIEIYFLVSWIRIWWWSLLPRLLINQWIMILSYGQWQRLAKQVISVPIASSELRSLFNWIIGSEGGKLVARQCYELANSSSIFYLQSFHRQYFLKHQYQAPIHFLASKHLLENQRDCHGHDNQYYPALSCPVVEVEVEALVFLEVSRKMAMDRKGPTPRSNCDQLVWERQAVSPAIQLAERESNLNP